MPRLAEPGHRKRRTERTDSTSSPGYVRLRFIREAESGRTRLRQRTMTGHGGARLCHIIRRARLRLRSQVDKDGVKVGYFSIKKLFFTPMKGLPLFILKNIKNY